jgi:uncharacterized membrane protein
MKRTRSIFLAFLFILIGSMQTASAAAQTPIIRAVLFFSPTCPACHAVMEEILPPIVDKYTDRLDVVGIDVSLPAGKQLYMDMVSAFTLPDDRLGVPTMIVGSSVLFGRYEIEEQLPDLIEKGLADQGIDWPAIPGLDAVLASQPANMTQIANSGAQSPSNQSQPNFVTAFLRDPIANSIAVVVLVGLIVTAIIVLTSYLRGPDRKFISFPDWFVPVLSLLGLFVALYLSYVEISGSKAVCGPVGNCNSVQESSYARLLGLIPIGVLGAVGYVGILAAWLARTYNLFQARRFFTLAIWGMAWFGVLFSIYLTFLEPFVIGATCAWCITSAIIMGLMLISTTAPAKEALRIELDEEDEIEVE